MDGILISNKYLKDKTLSWEERIILTLIESGNEYFKESGFKPNYNYFANKMYVDEDIILLIIRKLIDRGIIEDVKPKFEDKINKYTIL
mgnify:CR=1 FL=1